MRTFRARGAVSASVCQQLRAAMDRGMPAAADVLGEAIVRDESARRALEIDVDEAMLRVAEQHLESQRPDIEAFFDLRLGEREGASLLRYHTGGFYGPHRDRADVPSWPDALRRRIAVVLFLNSARAVDPAGGFSGGVLRIDTGASPLDIYPETGLIVAFPADTVHEVTEVRDGTRDAIVDWFYGGV
jgi:predicted 2-oxoglutarate/Fe(II)-dependent dioxygenase YbiX